MTSSRIVLFAPSVSVSVTIEEGDDGDDVHLHAGGQGIWVARMLTQFGHEAVVCAPVGGESGRAFQGLTDDWGIELRAVPTRADASVYVHDRRSGVREELARSRQHALDRHEADELYSATLEESLSADACVVTGRFEPDSVPLDVYRRLGTDLDRLGVPVVGDLHGPELDAFLDDGSLRMLKVSDDDLVEDGLLDDRDRSDAAADRVVRELAQRGVETVVLSRGDRPAVAFSGGGTFRIRGPALEVVDATGSGDSMTAAFVAGVVDGLTDHDILRRAWAAGAANVTRHGLGGADPGLIDALAERVRVEPLEPS